MKLTQSLYIRSLINKLHPPLPITPRDSNRLLASLKTSFQKQLDAAHPSPTKQASRHEEGVSVDGWSNTAKTATSSHVRSILSHPMLGTRQNVKNDANIHRALSSCVKEGSVDIPKLTHLVITYPPHGLAQFAAALTSWFNLLECKEREYILTSNVTDALVPTMMRTGHEATAWQWLEMLYTGSFGGINEQSAHDPSSDLWVQHEGRLVRQMAEYKICTERLLEAAEQIVAAIDYAVETRRHGCDRIGRDRSELSKALRAVIFRILQTRGVDLNATVYSAILQKMPPSNSIVLSTFLRLYQPTSDRAAFVQAEAMSFAMVMHRRDFQHHLQGYAQKVSGKQSINICGCMLDAVQLLIDAGAKSDASAALNLTERLFHIPLGLPNSLLPLEVSADSIQNHLSRLQHGLRSSASIIQNSLQTRQYHASFEHG